MRRACAVLLALVVVAACSDSKSPTEPVVLINTPTPTPGPNNVRVVGYILDTGTRELIHGNATVTIAVDAYPPVTSIVEATWYYDGPVGTYRIGVVAAGYAPVSWEYTKKEPGTFYYSAWLTRLPTPTPTSTAAGGLY